MSISDELRRLADQLDNANRPSVGDVVRWKTTLIKSYSECPSTTKCYEALVVYVDDEGLAWKILDSNPGNFGGGSWNWYFEHDIISVTKRGSHEVQIPG